MTKYVLFVYKDSASREQNKISLIIFYAKAQPMLYKDNASREQNKISSLVFYAKAQPMLSINQKILKHILLHHRHLK